MYCVLCGMQCAVSQCAVAVGPLLVLVRAAGHVRWPHCARNQEEPKHRDVNYNVCSRFTNANGTYTYMARARGARHALWPMTTPWQKQKVPKHRYNNVCSSSSSRIVTSAASRYYKYKWCWGETKHRNNNERCTELRSGRFGAFVHTKLIPKEETRFKRKIMICHKKHVLLDFSQ